MDPFIENLIGELSESPTELSDKNKKKIYEYIPVPSDFDILWADINSFGGYPSGIVLTNRGIICKAPRPDIKEKKKQEKNEKVYQIPYQIVLWEYFDPDDFICERAKNGNCYVIKSDGQMVTVFHDKSLIDFFKKYEKKLRMDEDLSNALIDGAVIGEVEALNIEKAAFHAAYGKDQTATGHGIYAEEAGAILDKLTGEKVTVVGRDNAKNGPDKLVNGSPVQCKFCKSAGSSVGACFKRNPNTGQMEYRYYDIKSGKPMKVEVPADQYEKAVEAMRRRIDNGQVPGVTNPDMAAELVRKGKLTYAQAKNLAKAGTLESLTFDTATGAINCSFAAGISSLASFGITYWRTNDFKRGAAIGFVAGAGGGLLAGVTVNKIANLFKEDDCIITARLFNAAIVNMSIEYFMSETEIDKLVELLDKDTKKIGKFQIQVRNSKHQYYDIQKFLAPYLNKAISGRAYISEKEEERVFMYGEIYTNAMKGEV